MIKIISTPSRQITCTNCKSVLEYEYQDIKRVKSRDYSGHGEINQGFDCPVCLYFVEVSS